MRAREKLNAVNVAGSLGIAGIAGWLVGSWWVFLIATPVLIACSLYVGSIRFTSGRKRV